jgi:hypothetical protein
MSFTEAMLAEREKKETAPMEDGHPPEETKDDTVIILLSEIARLIESRSVPNDEAARRIRDLRTKMLHEAAIQGVENCR